MPSFIHNHNINTRSEQLNLKLIFIERFIPESVRWLLVNGRKEEARKILERVAKVNKKEMPSDDFLVPVTTASKGVLELFKTWRLTKQLIIQIYAW